MVIPKLRLFHHDLISHLNPWPVEELQVNQVTMQDYLRDFGLVEAEKIYHHQVDQWFAELKLNLQKHLIMLEAT